MITFSNWLKVKESSPATRIKTQAALGLAPPVADIFSRATPPPWQVKRLKKALKRSHRKRKKHMFDEAKKAKPLNPEFDKFMKSVEALAKDMWDLQLVKKKKEAQDKLKELLKKHKLPVEVEEEKEKKKSSDKKDEDKKDKKKKDDRFKVKKVKVIKPKDEDVDE